MKPMMEDDDVRNVLAEVQLPLENIEYTIQEYLARNGSRLDLETRCLLSVVRDGVGRVAGSARRAAAARPRRAIPYERVQSAS